MLDRLRILQRQVRSLSVRSPQLSDLDERITNVLSSARRNEDSTTR